MKRHLFYLIFLFVGFATKAQVFKSQNQLVDGFSTVNFSNSAIETAKLPIIENIKLKTFNPDRVIYPDLPVPNDSRVKLFKGNIEVVDGSKSSPTNTSPAATTGFVGIVDKINSIPPDVNGAVGLNHVLTTLNGTEMKVQTKTGAGLMVTNPMVFFQSIRQTSSVFDPKSIYDPFTQRYFIVYLDGSTSTSNLLIAVSQTTDPTGNWNLYRIKTNVNETNLWFDFPTIGMNKDWFVISGNMFTTSNNQFTNVSVFALKKSDLVAGVVSPTVSKFKITNGAFTVSPAVVTDNTSDFVPLLSNWNRNFGTYRLFKLSGSNNPILEARGFPSIGSANKWLSYSYNYNEAPQKDMTSRTRGVDNGDHRMSNLIYRNGKIWATHTAHFSNTGNFDESSFYNSGVQWMQLDTTSTIHQFGKLVDPTFITYNSLTVSQNSYAYPSIAVNANEDVMIGYAHFSPNHYPSAGYIIRKSTDATNTMQSPYLFKQGEKYYYKTYSGAANRWGDYTATMTDPTNDLDFWTIGEYSYASDSLGYNRWATYWSKLEMGNSCLASDGGTTTGSTTVCAGSNSGSITLSGHTGTILRWESSTDNFATSSVISNTTATLNYTNLTQTTQFRAVVKNGTCSAVNSTISTITVTNATVAGSVSGNATVCTDTNSGTLTLSGHTGTILRWESSTDNFLTSLPISNTTTSLSYSNLLQSTQYRAIVQNGICTASPSTPATITVTAVSVGGSVASDATVCSGSNSGTLTLSGHSGSIVRWESSTDNFATITQIANTTTSLNYLNVVSTTQFRAVVQAGTCSAVNSSSATITTTPPSVGGNISGITTVCAGTNSGTLTLSGHTGSVIRWEASTDNFVSITIIPTTTTTHNFNNLLQTTKFRAVVQNGTCATANSSAATITVTQVNATATNTGPYLEGQTITLTATGGTSYSWTGPNSFSSTSNPASIPNATVAMSGVYVVTATQGECTGTASTQVIVNKIGECTDIATYDYVRAGNPFTYMFPLTNNLTIAEVPYETSILVTPTCATVPIESFRMKLEGPSPYENHEVIENISYYALFNNTGAYVLGRNLPIGNYKLTVTGYAADDANGLILFGPNVTNFNIIRNNAAIYQPSFTINSLCAGSTFTVSFFATGDFGAGNMFNILLSDASGSFDNPIVIGSTATVGPVSCTIPMNIGEGTGYKLKVISTNQVVAGDPNNTTLQLDASSVSLVSPTHNFETGPSITKRAGSTIVATNQIKNTANVTYHAGNSITLKPGFQAIPNAVFKAQIKSCGEN